MNKQLINTLLRIVQSPEAKFSAGKGLVQFCAEYSVGIKRGSTIEFLAVHKRTIAKLLLAQHNIDAYSVTPDAWQGLSRSESLALGANEKHTRQAVSTGRVRVRALGVRRLAIAGVSINLPTGADLGIGVAEILKHDIGHDGVLVVENLETFLHIDQVDPEVMGRLPCDNPLVVYRGDAQGGARTDAVYDLAAQANLPVYAFVDFDPAGMIIAASLPNLRGLLHPDLELLADLLAHHGIRERFVDQLARTPEALDAIAADACESIRLTWRVIEAAGKGLPQEYFTSRPMGRPDNRGGQVKKIEGKTVRFSLDPNNPPTLTADQERELAALRNKADSDIDYSDLPELDEAFWAKQPPKA